MTREEAKNKVQIKKVETYPYGIIDNVDEVIDQIFDEFCEQLQDKDYEIELFKQLLEEAMKPKTCYGCSNLFFDEIEKVYKCSNDVSDDVGYLHGEAVIRNIKDFYCAQYRSKDNA